jgi:NADP+-dependent farnesol dehydrogenase
MDKWRGKTAIVTGASSGIGAAIVRSFAEAGINVIALARRLENIESLKKELENESGKVTAIRCDVSDRKSVEEAFKIIENSFDFINILVNNAGIGK